jgi:hypothetical protein
MVIRSNEIAIVYNGLSWFCDCNVPEVLSFALTKENVINLHSA